MWHYISFLIAGVPVFYFYLPIYAFWHMDDLSWGKTRKVQEPTKRAIPSGEAKGPEDDFGSSSSSEDTSEAIETAAGSGSSGLGDEEAPSVALNTTVVGAQVGARASTASKAMLESCLACMDDRKSGPDFEQGKLAEPLLPKIRCTCTCGRQEQNPEDIRALDVILRPWQVQFVKSLGIDSTAQAFRMHYHENKFLPKFLKAWREQSGLPSTDVDTYRIALLVWDRTCKAILDSYDNQIRDGVDVPRLPTFHKCSDDGKSVASGSTADDDGSKSSASESQSLEGDVDFRSNNSADF